MSESIRRRSSSRQLLQNLIRVTAQRSQEDAEEVERERRRRARDKQRGDESPPRPEPPPTKQSHSQHRVTDLCSVVRSDEDLKPGSRQVLEEDEGFSDWSHRLENRNEHEAQDEFRLKELRPSGPPDPEEAKQQEDGEEDRGKPEQSCQSEDVSTEPPEKTSLRKHAFRTSYSSSVFMSQDSRPLHAAGQPPERTSYLAAGTIEARGAACKVDEEVEQEKQKKRSEEGRIWRSEVVSSRCAGSLCSSSEGEESLNCYGPMSPTFKKLLIQFYPEEVNSRVSPDGKCTITERTESLRRSVGNIKKTVPPVPVSRIDKKLEQYAHALEVTAHAEGRISQALTDLASPAEPVASKKNLFEAGEAWNQNVTSVTPSKDADGLKVGVANLINQWVKGSEDGNRCSSPSKPAESAAQRYKYVVTGHGKYEKVSVDQGCREDVNYQAARFTIIIFATSLL
ncbi:lymphocyte-specific protein 1-like [Xenentodon cancila]